MNGRTHSNVVSMTLNDYRVAPGVMFIPVVIRSLHFRKEV